jgi:hypothetical protein
MINFTSFAHHITFQKFLTTYFDQCFHHQVLKIIVDETVVFVTVAPIVNFLTYGPLYAHVCL